MDNFDDLKKEIIDTGLCTHCGACVSVCPDYNIEWGEDDKPHRDEAKGMCEECTDCYDKCHRVKGHFMLNEMDEFLFGRSRTEKELFGIFKRMVKARSTDPAILKTCQDGGIATALALYLLEHDEVDGVITTGVSKEMGAWKPVSMIATSREELLASSGTKYYIAPLLTMLKQGVIDQELDRLAIIGLPCHVHSARYLQKTEFDLAPAIMEVIGLFCTQNYHYSLIEETVRQMGLNITDVKKFIISNGKLRLLHDSGESSISLKDMKDKVTEFCAYCDDFSAEFADISIGSQGSQQGWSTIIIRTERGEELFNELEKSGLIEVKELEKEEVIKTNSVKKRDKAITS